MSILEIDLFLFKKSSLQNYIYSADYILGFIIITNMKYPVATILTVALFFTCISFSNSINCDYTIN